MKLPSQNNSIHIGREYNLVQINKILSFLQLSGFVSVLTTACMLTAFLNAKIASFSQPCNENTGLY